MTKEELNFIQQKIGYPFKNPMLLQQAFIRRSYSQENPDCEDNEVLEFIGDSELDSFVVRKLCKKSYLNEKKQFVCEKNEGELTKLRSKYVDKQSLSHCIDILGFNKYLIMGKSDIYNGAKDSNSVKEDLFEAIVGAVAIDSDFNNDKIAIVCDSMLGYLNFEDDYISLLSEWCEERGYSEPYYISNSLKLYNGQYSCNVSITDKSSFKRIEKSGEGKTVELAKMNAAETLYYEYCEIIDMYFAVGNPDFDKAISQLHELAQKDFFSEPDYSFVEKHDESGKPVWKCFCKINEYDEDGVETEFFSSKKEAKKEAAYLELCYVLEIEEDRLDDNIDDDMYYED